MRLVLTRERALKFLKAIGYKTAIDWDDNQICTKLLNIAEMIDVVKLEKFPMKKLLNKVITADSIRIKSDDDNNSKKETSKMSKKKKKKTEEQVDEQVEKPKKDKSKKDKKDKGKKDKKNKSKKDKSKKDKKNTSKKDKKNTSKKDKKNTSKKDKKNTSKKDKKNTSKKDKSKKDKDKFGSTIGTFASEVNKVLSNKAQSRKEILVKVGKKGSCSSHLKRLVKEGFLVQLKDKSYKLTK
jgi:hypothetical protein